MASKPQRNPPKSSPAGSVVSTSQQWSGPLPPPQALEQFNSIIPNGAERIISMVEREQAHRLEIEAAAIAATIKDTKRGHWMGFYISIAAIVAAALTAYLGAHPSVSIALVGLPIAAIVRSFLLRNSNDSAAD